MESEFRYLCASLNLRFLLMRMTRWILSEVYLYKKICARCTAKSHKSIIGDTMFQKTAYLCGFVYFLYHMHCNEEICVKYRRY